MLLNYRHTRLQLFYPRHEIMRSIQVRDFYGISQAGVSLSEACRLRQIRVTTIHVAYDVWPLSLLLLSFYFLSSVHTILIISCTLRCAPLRVWTHGARIHRKDTAWNERATDEQCNDKRAWTQPGIVPISARKEAHPPALNKLDIQFTWRYAKIFIDRSTSLHFYSNKLVRSKVRYFIRI